MYLTGTPRDYVGDVSAPIYPGVYVAYKTGKLAFSAGFNPIGGGGGATYNTGLPSFEMPISDLKPLLTGMGLTTTQYTADIFFEGTSVYFGYQANVSYAINDMISVAVGGRLVTAKNTYNGYIKNIKINPYICRKSNRSFNTGFCIFYSYWSACLCCTNSRQGS